MARNDQLIRQHRLVELLTRSRFGHTLGELRQMLVEEFGLPDLSERTIRRDLEALVAAGFDVETDVEERGTVWYAGVAMRQAPQITLSAMELTALAVGRDLLAPLAGTPLNEGIERLWHRLEEALPEAVLKQFERQRRALHVHAPPRRDYGEKRGLITALSRAILQHRLVALTYQAAKGPVERTVQPLSVVIAPTGVYLLAEVPDAPEGRRSRLYKVDRIDKVDPQDARVPPPNGYDPAVRFADSLSTFSSGPSEAFAVRFEASLARWVKDAPFHPHQTLETAEDGTVIAHISAAHAEEIVARVLPFGPRVEILSPESARERLGELARATAALYAGD